MKCISITKFGEPSVLQMKETNKPKPSSNQVLIAVKAAGINRPDVFQRKGHYPPPKNTSQDVPGLEIAGVVADIGSHVSKWKSGDKVCALIAGGGYAEFVTADEGSCLPVPDNLSFTEAAVLPETIFTVWSNVFMRGNLQPGESLLVHGGSSGIGTTAIQLAVAFGSPVFVTAGSDEKCKACEKLGAKCINYKKEDFAEVIGEEKIDVILDMIGGDYFARNIRVLKTEGRLVFINAMKGPVGEMKIKDIMTKRLTVTGSTLRARELSFKNEVASSVYKHVWPLFSQEKFKPVIAKTFKLEDASKAHELMEEGSHVGKIVLTVAEY